MACVGAGDTAVSELYRKRIKSWSELKAKKIATPCSRVETSGMLPSRDKAFEAGCPPSARVDENNFTHLAYATGIAGAMLRRQQAQAVVPARRAWSKGRSGWSRWHSKCSPRRGSSSSMSIAAWRSSPTLMVVLCTSATPSRSSMPDQRCHEVVAVAGNPIRTLP